MSQELPNISKIPQLNKTACTNILDVFRERENSFTEFTKSLKDKGIHKFSKISKTFVYFFRNSLNFFTEFVKLY